MKLVMVENMDQVLEHALRRRPRPLPTGPVGPARKAAAPKSVGEPAHGRGPGFPPAEQPPAIVSGH